MIYSIWNQGARRFDYFETREENGKANAEPPSHLRPGKLGVTMQQAAWLLPVDAKPIGSGPYAQGRIAAPRDGATAVGDVALPLSAMWLALGIGAAAILRRIL
jgi:hypothetical protein